MPKNRLILTVASIALGGLCLADAAMAQAPSTSPPATSPPSTTAPSTRSPTTGGATQSVNPSSFMTEMRPGMWRATKLDGLDVYNDNNEKVGDINELLLDSSGKVQAVIIGVGGFLGMGERYVAVPFEQIRWSNESVRSARAGSTSTSPSGSSSSATAPSGTSDRSDVTGSTRSGSSTSSGDVSTRGYPDHALLNMTKEQLRSAPEFKYSSSR